MKYTLAIFASIMLIACSGPKEIVMEAPPMEEEILDTLVVTAPPITSENKEDPIPQELPKYNPSATRDMDLLHTQLDLRFDWKKQWVLGWASIEMTPVFYPQQKVVLDAKGFEFESIKLNGRSLAFTYDNYQVDITLDRTYQRGEKLTLTIEYIAKPNEGPEGGSAAISSDKGLFFINPLNEEAGKPMQIWTQGETENNSRWFPTFDKPNERMSQEISLTVDNRFVTLSNGSLVSSVNNSDGTRTDTWRQSQPHAPYLAMIAIGEYAVVSETIDNLEYTYYVEEDYRPYAKEIFNHTPEMMAFFSDILGYPYPWDKYAQVVTRDYVSGAMENTTAVIFGDFVQKTGRELIDNDNDNIVAHELFHHWFGNLVTCESWANLTLQEGFANYGEYLWLEYKYGRARADKHRIGELQGYLMSAQNQGTHPLIHYEYDNKESMFDAHSYNKGGLVLHMLRNQVGDEAFFASLNKFLKNNAYSAMEVDELRMAFEDTTGEDLQWFFDQWFLAPGHPRVKINYEYLPDERKQFIIVDQIQDMVDHLPVYRLEMDIAVYDSLGGVTYYPAVMDTRKTQFEIDDIDRPAVVVFDGRGDLLAVIIEERTATEQTAMLKFSDNYEDRINAARSLRRSPVFASLAEELLKDDHEDIRKMAIEAMNIRSNPSLKEALLTIIVEDPHSSVRNAALSKLIDTDYTGNRQLVFDILEGDDAYVLTSTALKAMKRNDDPEMYTYASGYDDVNHPGIVSVIADIYASSGDASYLGYFEDRLQTVSLFAMFNFYNKYFDLLKGMPAEVQLKAAQRLSEISLSRANMFRKFVATSTINKMEDTFKAKGDEVMNIKLREILNAIISQESDEQLLARYRSF